MTDTLRGLLVGVLRSSFGDCTNGGVTDRFSSFVLVNPALPGYAEVFAPDANTPALKVVKRVIGGHTYVHAEPIELPPAGHVGWMAGGNFIWTSDGRYAGLTGVGYPIAVHDRSESLELYEALSR